MVVRLGKFLVIAALVLTTGAHWAALQTVAWATMLANNLCRDSLVQAVSKTFDGEHLCPLCKAIVAAKKSEKKTAAVAPVLKMEFPPVVGKFVLLPPKPIPAFFAARFSADSCSLRPPVPPPRTSPA